MTINMYCKEGYEIASETFRKIEKVEEVQCNLGTFIDIIDEGNSTTSLTARHIKRLEKLNTAIELSINEELPYITRSIIMREPIRLSD